MGDGSTSFLMQFFFPLAGGGVVFDLNNKENSVILNV